MANQESKGQKILVKAIIEMLGAPKEHIENTLKEYIEGLKKDKNNEILNVELAPAKEQEDLFSAFAELDIRFGSAGKLVEFCFDSMPSSIEIIEPDRIEIDSPGFSSILNDMQAKLHNNDMIIKTLKAKGALLDKNAKSVLTNFIYFILDSGPKEISNISEAMGIAPEHLKPFLKELEKKGSVSEKEGRYERVK